MAAGKGHSLRIESLLCVAVAEDRLDDGFARDGID
jgi:hypothetical protein